MKGWELGLLGGGWKAAKRGDIEMIASRCMEGHLLWFIIESEFDEEVDSIKEPLTSSSYAN